MKLSTTKILAAALLLAAGTQQAFAAETHQGATASSNNAGDTITNTATVQYSIGGVVQVTEPTGQAAFTVDRLIDVTVTSMGDTNVTPGATGKALAFTVTNNTNSVMDFALSAANVTGDDFNAGTFTYYADSDGDGVFLPGVGHDQLLPLDGGVPYLDEMTANETRRVFVVADIPNPVAPNALENDDEAQVTLLAVAHDGGSATHLGDESEGTDNTDANTLGGAADNVFNDVATAGDLTGTGFTDGAKDGKHSDTGAYKVATATIGVTKTAFVLNDPINGTTNPKAIPGATILYCIAVSNDNTADATAVTVSDPIPTGTSYFNNSGAGTIRVIAGAVTCDATALTKGDDMTDAQDNFGDESLTSSDPAANPANTKGDAGAGGTGPITTMTDLPKNGTTTTIFQVKVD